MKRITYRDDDNRCRLTRAGNGIYCSTQATADMLAMYEELLESLGYQFEDNAEDIAESKETREAVKIKYKKGFCSRCGRPVIAKEKEAFWWPGGSSDDHLCISCDVCGGLAEVD